MFNKTKQHIMPLCLAIGSALLALVLLSGCATGSPIQIGNLFTVGDSQTTTDQDLENTITFENEDGTEECMNVIKFSPVNSNNFDDKALRQLLDDEGIQWYQLVVDDNRQAPVKEYSYLYMPASSNYTEMQNLENFFINDGYDAAVMSEEEYNEFYNSVSGSNFSSRVTYYGPVALANNSSDGSGEQAAE